MKSVKIEAIKVNATESINNNLVVDLANSIKEIGLMNAIVLTPSFELVAGRHRLEACKKLKYKRIIAKIVTLDDLKMRLAAIDEDLIRKRLTALEEAEYLSERKDIYLKLHPETMQGLAGALGKHKKGAKDKPSFADDAANKTSQSSRNVNRKIYLAKNLYQEIRDLIRTTTIADSMTEMKKLSQYPPEIQKEVAELIRTGQAKTIAEADKILGWTLVSEKTAKEKFDKSIKLAEQALNQLIEKGVIQKLVESLPEINYVVSESANLEALKNLQERLNEAISIFENNIGKLATEKIVVIAENQEMALSV